MNKREISEIKKQFKKDNNAITRICGCYVDGDKEKKLEFKEAFLSLPEEEEFKYFDLFKRTLSGTVGKNLLNMSFPLDEELKGGAQEFRKRAGTENLPGILGMAAALEASCRNMEASAQRVSHMRDRLLQGIRSIPATRVNGSLTHRMPGNLNVCFEGIEGESLLLRLDLAGICASSGSACTSGSLEPSHVLLAIGVPKELAHGSLRLSLDETNTEEEVDHILEKLPGIVAELRAMSPVWDEAGQRMKAVEV